MRSRLLSAVTGAAVGNRHRCAHGQVAHAQIHNSRACGTQLPHHSIRQPIHQRAVASQADHKEPPSAVAAGHHFSDSVRQHLIADLLVLPLLQPGSGDLHRLLEGGLLLRHGRDLPFKPGYGRNCTTKRGQ